MTEAEALEASILHWQENVKAAATENVKMGADRCALCAMFLEHDCKGCPVMQRTGYPGCLRSPYRAVWAAYLMWKYTKLSSCANIWLAARDEFRKAAQAEVDFLISLRETE